NWVRSCAQTASIPTNSVIDVSAAASSTKILNIIDLPCGTYSEQCSTFVPWSRHGSGSAWEKSLTVNGLALEEKSPSRGQGLSVHRSTLRSLPRNARSAEAVVYAGGEEIKVLADVVRKRPSRRCKGVGVRAQEHVIVFNGDRPVRHETIFEADAERAAPAGFVRGAEQRARGIAKD